MEKMIFGPIRAGHAASQIGAWPLKHPGTYSPSWLHARRTWNETLGHLAEQRIDPRAEQLVPLVFLGRLANHVVGCRRCCVTGALDTRTPEAILRIGIRTAPLTRDTLARVQGGTPRRRQVA